MQRRLTCFFVKFLYLTDALDKFTKNISSEYGSIDFYVDDFLRRGGDPQALVACAFVWGKGLESISFWADMSMKWKIVTECFPKSREWLLYVSP